MISDMMYNIFYDIHVHNILYHNVWNTLWTLLLSILQTNSKEDTTCVTQWILVSSFGQLARDGEDNLGLKHLLDGSYSL